MATGDFTLYQSGPFGEVGSRKHQVAAGATTIYPGEPVVKVLGSSVVTAMATNKPVVGTDYMVGIAASKSTQTSTAAGTVEVTPLMPGQVWICAPTVAATWNTQSEYDALVGYRVLIDLTSSTYTVLAADSTTYGAVVRDLDVSKIPGKVAVTFRNGANYLA